MAKYKENKSLHEELVKLKAAVEEMEHNIIKAIEWILIPVLGFLTRLLNWVSKTFNKIKINKGGS